MHLSQRKLCTRKMELALEGKSYLDFNWVARPWRRTLTNGSDVKYVFSLTNGSDVKYVFPLTNGNDVNTYFRVVHARWVAYTSPVPWGVCDAGYLPLLMPFFMSLGKESNASVCGEEKEAAWNWFYNTVQHWKQHTHQDDAQLSGDIGGTKSREVGDHKPDFALTKWNWISRNWVTVYALFTPLDRLTSVLRRTCGCSCRDGFLATVWIGYLHRNCFKYASCLRSIAGDYWVRRRCLAWLPCAVTLSIVRWKLFELTSCQW